MSNTVDEALAEAEREGGGRDDPRLEAAEADTRLHAAVVFEMIRREGSGELSRGATALWWSGLAAGLSIGFSVLAEAMLNAKLPDAPWKPLVDNLGYCVGFLIVIMARQQLFTENTLTAVLPVIARRSWSWVLVLLRLWGIVLAANLVGCFLFAAFISQTNVLAPDVQAAVLEIGKHMMENTPSEMFIKGIAAGFLIAALVWMLPSAEHSAFLVITLMTYLIALGDFTHVIAGSAEAFYLWFVGQETFGTISLGFFVPTLLGNVFGGTVLFALLSYAQVREEIVSDD